MVAFDETYHVLNKTTAQTLRMCMYICILSHVWKYQIAIEYVYITLNPNICIYCLHIPDMYVQTNVTINMHSSEKIGLKHEHTASV